jgi:hypothetical protein
MRVIGYIPLAHASISCRAANAYPNAGFSSMLNFGHGRSPLWRGSQKYYRDLSPDYGRSLCKLAAALAGVTFNGVSLPTSYGTELASKATLMVCDVHPAAITVNFVSGNTTGTVYDITGGTVGMLSVAGEYQIAHNDKHRC